MRDEKIIELFFCRDEQAIQESMNTYGAYCRTIAAGILQNSEDIEEAVADTWLAAWDSIPPNRPIIYDWQTGEKTALDTY